jgi:hypothetical protein
LFIGSGAGAALAAGFVDAAMSGEDDLGAGPGIAVGGLFILAEVGLGEAFVGEEKGT